MTTYVQDEDGKWIEKSKRKYKDVNAPMFMPDIEPYQSTITGEQITSRSRHRKHLKEHKCIEMGDQKPKWME